MTQVTTASVTTVTSVPASRVSVMVTLSSVTQRRAPASTAVPTQRATDVTSALRVTLVIRYRPSRACLAPAHSQSTQTSKSKALCIFCVFIYQWPLHWQKKTICMTLPVISCFLYHKNKEIYLYSKAHVCTYVPLVFSFTMKWWDFSIPTNE